MLVAATKQHVRDKLMTGWGYLWHSCGTQIAFDAGGLMTCSKCRAAWRAVVALGFTEEQIAERFRVSVPDEAIKTERIVWISNGRVTYAGAIYDSAPEEKSGRWENPDGTHGTWEAFPDGALGES